MPIPVLGEFDLLFFRNLASGHHGDSDAIADDVGGALLTSRHLRPIPLFL